MLNKVLELQPNNYYTLDNELCFYLGENVSRKLGSDEAVAAFIREICDLGYLTIYSRNKEDGNDFFRAMTSNYQLKLARSEKNNFSIVSVFSGREFQAKKKYLYGLGVFLVILEEGTSVIYRHEKYSNDSRSNDWGMSSDSMNAFVYAVDDYFFSEGKTNTTKIDKRFDMQVLQPVRNFTHYEDIVEQMASMGGEHFQYDYYTVERGSSAKQKEYLFFSSTFDSEKENFQIGDRVAVNTNEKINDELNRTIKGTIIDRSLEEDGVCLRIEFVEQFDDYLFENKGGYIYPQVNETQKRVRNGVLRSIQNGSAISKYMYHLFSKYETEGYEPQDGWEEFKKELENEKYPTNKSQMEAIQRGIETKDIQLVLGPPGTGKTTVIVSWIKYFIRHGKRVLVSSQNNAAVDNVLERVGKSKDARIIRLGNLSKIQDNCKKYSTEEQIESTAEKYVNKLKDSQGKISNDIRELEQKINLINKDMPIILQFQEDAKTRDKYVEVANQISINIKNSFQQYLSKKNVYTSLLNDKTHKEIALFAIRRKNAFWRFLFQPLSIYMKKELVQIIKKLEYEFPVFDASKGKYEDSIRQLNDFLSDADYKALKNRYGEYEEQIRQAAYTPTLAGPFSVDKFDTSVLVSNPRQAIETVEKYKNVLESILYNVRLVKKTLDDWEIAINSKRSEIVTNLLIENSNVVGATCIGINTRRQFQNLDFDVSIIDESGQIQVHNVIVPMSRAPKTLMLGDHLQIPPMANEEVVKLCKQDGIKTDLLEMSFFEFLFKKLENKNPDTPNITRLDEQFRMPGNISDVISDWFYGGNYHAHYDMSEWEPMIKGTSKPLIIISTSRASNRFEQNKYNSPDKTEGYGNELEADIVGNIIENVFSDRKPDSEQVGVISAYGRQVRLIRKIISAKKLGFSSEQVYSIAASLDSFQGQERPLIIYSSTRSTDPNGRFYKSPDKARVGFMKELRRLNVAFTRCQKQLVIIGDFDYLTSCEYEEIDPNTNKPIPNKSEKEYSRFMQKMLDQAIGEAGEFYYLDEFYQRVGING